MNEAGEFTFYDRPIGPGDYYRRNPEGEYHQFFPIRHGGWVRCNQNDNGLRARKLSQFPKDVQVRAFESAVSVGRKSEEAP